MLDGQDLGTSFIVVAQNPDAFGKYDRMNYPVEGLLSMQWRKILNPDTRTTIIQVLAVYDSLDAASGAFELQTAVLLISGAKDVEEIDVDLGSDSVLVSFISEGQSGEERFGVGLLLEKNIVTMVQADSDTLLKRNATKYLESALAKIETPAEEDRFISLEIQDALDQLEQEVTTMTFYSAPEYGSQGPEVFADTDDENWVDDVTAIFLTIYEVGRDRPELIPSMTVVLNGTEEGPFLLSCSYENVQHLKEEEISFAEFQENCECYGAALADC